MTIENGPELLLLHALPLDGSMWAGQMDLLPGSTYAPTLYPLGDSIEEWATEALKLVSSDRLIVVGCSVGGSCALEIAVAAPDRVSALVLIGTKVAHRPDPALHASALETLQERGIEHAWRRFWAPLFSNFAAIEMVDDAKRTALRQSARQVAQGVTAFHTRPSRERFLSTFVRPVIIVSGAEDIAPGLKTSAAQAHLAPHGRLHIIPQCGHYVPLERPEHLNAVLRDVIVAQR